MQTVPERQSLSTSANERCQRRPNAAGCTQKQLMDAYGEVNKPIRGRARLSRISTLLKQTGHAKAMPTVVERMPTPARGEMQTATPSLRVLIKVATDLRYLGRR